MHIYTRKIFPGSWAAGMQRQELLVTSDQVTLVAWQVGPMSLESQENSRGKREGPGN